MTVDLFCSERHFLDHLWPIWRALGRHRGTLYIGRSLVEHARALGLDAKPERPGGNWPPILVASYQDLASNRAHPVILLEHGAGQTYQGAWAHPSYAGGTERDSAILYLAPNLELARVNQQGAPRSAIAVVGCPKLDAVFAARASVVTDRSVLTSGPRGRDHTPRPHPCVAISFHADIHLVPETRWAFGAYERFLPGAVAELRAAGVEVLGHAHPRVWPRLERFWRSMGVEAVREFSDVLERASLYVIDNSSTAVEFMASGKPVGWMNAPWYRRDVHHGKRFWEWEGAGALIPASNRMGASILEALDEPPERARLREQVVSQVYAVRDGTSAKRAVTAIVEVIEGLEPQERPTMSNPYRSRRRMTNRAEPYPMKDTVPDVLRWVGTDAERAREALRAERQRKSPRKTLVDSLEGLTK